MFEIITKAEQKWRDENPNFWCAIRDGELIDHDDDLTALDKRIKELGVTVYYTKNWHSPHHKISPDHPIQESIQENEGLD